MCFRRLRRTWTKLTEPPTSFRYSPATQKISALVCLSEPFSPTLNNMYQSYGEGGYVSGTTRRPVNRVISDKKLEWGPKSFPIRAFMCFSRPQHYTCTEECSRIGADRSSECPHRPPARACWLIV